MPGLLGLEKAERGEPVDYSVEEMADYLAGEFSGAGSDLLSALSEHGFKLVKTEPSEQEEGEEGADKSLKSGKPKISIAIMREHAVNSAMDNSGKEEY